MGNVFINADDYGMTPEINAAILQATRERLIHSVSVDVCNEITRSNAGKLLAMGISIGLHLNLTEGRPIGNGEGITDLLDTGGRFKPASLGLKSDAELGPVFFELQHQLEQFRFYFDREPTHLDSHQHFTYLHPPAFEAMLKLATAEDIPIRSPKPFIQIESLGNFCERVRSRYGISLALVPEERAAVLKELFCRYRPRLRCQDLYLDFDPKVLEQLHLGTTCAEMIVHPHLESVRGVNGI
jgi:predicted glycoside hydrolase/deacetylase ChbG (UPF0249 family)